MNSVILNRRPLRLTTIIAAKQGIGSDSRSGTKASMTINKTTQEKPLIRAVFLPLSPCTIERLNEPELG